VASGDACLAARADVEVDLESVLFTRGRRGRREQIPVKAHVRGKDFVLVALREALDGGQLSLFAEEMLEERQTALVVARLDETDRQRRRRGKRLGHEITTASLRGHTLTSIADDRGDLVDRRQLHPTSRLRLGPGRWRSPVDRPTGTLPLFKSNVFL
jgi:hypothetical protein